MSRKSFPRSAFVAQQTLGIDSEPPAVCESAWHVNVCVHHMYLSFSVSSWCSRGSRLCDPARLLVFVCLVYP